MTVSFFSERVIGRWNNLPQYVIDSRSINAFNNGLNIMRRDSMGFFMDWLVRLAIRPHLFLRIPVPCLGPRSTRSCGGDADLNWKGPQGSGKNFDSN